MREDYLKKKIQDPRAEYATRGKTFKTKHRHKITKYININNEKSKCILWIKFKPIIEINHRKERKKNLIIIITS